MEYTEQQQALLQKVTALQQEKQLSQNALGKLLGISGTALSQLRNGKYQADPQRMFDILESYFGVKEQTERALIRKCHMQIPVFPKKFMM